MINKQFFDKNDMLSQYQLRSKLQQLRTERNYYQAEIAKSKVNLSNIYVVIKLFLSAVVSNG